MDKKNAPIVDGQIVDDSPTSDKSESQDQGTAADVLINLESLIKTHISGLETRRSEMKKIKEMLNDSFGNDAGYQEADKEVKEANKKKKDAKSRLMKLPEVQKVADKLREFVTEVKEMEMALEDYLREYQRLSGSNEITDDNGNVHEIILVPKLLKKAG